MTNLMKNCTTIMSDIPSKIHSFLIRFCLFTYAISANIRIAPTFLKTYYKDCIFHLTNFFKGKGNSDLFPCFKTFSDCIFFIFITSIFWIIKKAISQFIINRPNFLMIFWLLFFQSWYFFITRF